MKKGKKRLIFLTIALIFLAMIGTANAIPTAASCEILEKPQDIEVSCSDIFIIIDDKVVDIKFLETPNGEIDKSIYQQLLIQQEHLKEETGIKESVVPLPRWESTTAIPRYGKYVLRINDSYNISILYGENRLTENYLYLGLFTSFGIFIAIGLFLKLTKKNTKIGNIILIVVGIALILIFISQLLVV